MAGFEPAISSSPSLRDARLRYTLASRRGRIRTADLVLPKHAGFQATPRTETKSAQRELNPHFRHGKAAGYRYIMGASNRWSNCQRTEHRVGLEPTSPHYGCGVLAAGRPVLFHSVGSEGLEPSPTWLRARHAAASTLIPCSCFASRCLCAQCGRGGNRTLDLVLIRDLLSPLSYAPPR